MALDGKPNVAVPKLNERAVQDSVLAIRQRLAILDAAVRVLQNTGTSQQIISNLQTQVAVLQNQINLISGGIFLAQNPNLFFAGPTEGSAATPEFRLVDWLDLPPVADLPDQSGLTGGELVRVELAGVSYQTTVQDIADLAPSHSGGSGGGAVTSVNGQVGDVLLDAGDVGAVPGVDYVPPLASGIDGDEILVAQKGSGYYSLTAQQIADLVEAGGYTYSSTEPAFPTPGDRWFDPDVGVMFTYIDDGTSSQWVEV